MPGPVWELVWLNLTAILRECSHAGTANCQYVLPGRSKQRVSDPRVAFRAGAGRILDDIFNFRAWGAKPLSRLRVGDSRSGIGDHEFDLLITSPPYPNNYDYGDATRLEMTFWGLVATWGDLQEAVRKHLIRSCSQQSAAQRLDLHEVLADPLLDPIRDDLVPVCEKLGEVRLTKGGKKNLPHHGGSLFP